MQICCIPSPQRDTNRTAPSKESKLFRLAGETVSDDSDEDEFKRKEERKEKHERERERERER